MEAGSWYTKKEKKIAVGKMFKNLLDQYRPPNTNEFHMIFNLVENMIEGKLTLAAAQKHIVFWSPKETVLFLTDFSNDSSASARVETGTYKGQTLRNFFNDQTHRVLDPNDTKTADGWLSRLSYSVKLFAQTDVDQPQQQSARNSSRRGSRQGSTQTEESKYAKYNGLKL